MEIEEINLKDLKKYQKHFSETALWKKMKKVGEKAGLKIGYAAMLLYYAFRSDKVTFQTKATIIGALGYLIFPIDIIPDFIPFLGFSDDLGALLIAITQIREVITPDIKQKAREKVEEWFPQFDDAEVVEVEDATKVSDYTEEDWEISEPK